MWQPTDYVLRGEFCPLSAIEAQLNALRIDLGAGILVHLAFDHELIMRSMCFACGVPTDDVGLLNQVLQTRDYRWAHRGLTQACLDVAAEAEARRWCRIPDAAARELQELTLNTLRRSRRGAHRADAFDALRLYATYVSNTGRDDVRPRNGEVRSILLTDVADTTDRLQGEDVDVELIGAALKTTTHAHTRRDAVVMTEVGERLHLGSSAAGASDRLITDLASDALDIALEITASDAGAVYQLVTSRDAASHVYRRLAHRDVEGSAYPQEIPADEASALEWSISRHRAIQVPPGGPAASRKSRTNGSTRGTELITPISGPLASPTSAAVGALSVYRSQDVDRSSFGAYDLALLRNLSLRLALLRTTSATNEIAQAMALLRTKLSAPLDVDQLELDPRVPTPLPKDVRLSLIRFADPLRQLANSTNSHAVSIRLVLPAPDATEDHGLALWRVAAYPDDRLEDHRPILYERVGGISWVVARDGASTYTPDTEKDERYVASRLGTRSELCVPVRVEGHLAGVLNLESTIVDNYAPLRPLVIAFSAALGRTLADCTSFFTQDVLDRAAIGISKKHEIDHLVDELERVMRAQQLSVEARLAVDKMVGATRTKLNEIRQPPRRPQTEARPLAEILHTSLEKSDLMIELPEPPDTSGFRSALDPQQTQALMVTFESLFDNIVNYTVGSAYVDDVPTRAIRYGQTRLDGHDFAVVLLSNYSDEIDQARSAELHRYPLEAQSGRIRLGAFIAGLNARRAGARVHSTLVDGGRVVRTTVLVPNPEA